MADNTQPPFSDNTLDFTPEKARITLPSSESWAFGQNDFTIEAWVYNKNLVDTPDFKNDRTIFGSMNGHRGNQFLFYVTDSGKLAFWNGRTSVGGGTLSNDTWHDVALVRRNLRLYMYLDGRIVYSGCHLADHQQMYGYSIGAVYDPYVNGNKWTRFFDGYMQDVRVAHHAVYTCNFHVPDKLLYKCSADERCPTPCYLYINYDFNMPWYMGGRYKNNTHPIEVEKNQDSQTISHIFMTTQRGQYGPGTNTGTIRNVKISTSSDGPWADVTVNLATRKEEIYSANTAYTAISFDIEIPKVTSDCQIEITPPIAQPTPTPTPTPFTLPVGEWGYKVKRTLDGREEQITAGMVEPTPRIGDFVTTEYDGNEYYCWEIIGYATGDNPYAYYGVNHCDPSQFPTPTPTETTSTTPCTLNIRVGGWLQGHNKFGSNWTRSFQIENGEVVRYANGEEFEDIYSHDQSYFYQFNEMLPDNVFRMLTLTPAGNFGQSYAFNIQIQRGNGIWIDAEVDYDSKMLHDPHPQTGYIPITYDIKLPDTTCICEFGVISSPSNSIGDEHTDYIGSAFNGNVTATNMANAWHSYDTTLGANMTTGVIGQSFSTPQIVTHYRIYPWYWSTRDQDPKNWTFEASNDNFNTVVILDTQTDTVFTFVDSNGNYTSNEYNINNTDAYMQYRLNITSNNGSQTNLIIQEIEFLGCE